jgi:hypothetical protein
LKKVDHETILKDFEGWDEHYVKLLKVSVIAELFERTDTRLILTAWMMSSILFVRCSSYPRASGFSGRCTRCYPRRLGVKVG